jgi:hypothetical protein
VATRFRDGQQTYHDLRERTKRREDRREENLRRIVELYRARSLHSFPSEILPAGAAGDGTGS